MSVAKHLMMAGSGGIGFTYVYSTDTANVVLYDDLIAAGWNEVYDVTVFINSGVKIYGSTAMTIAGFPSGVDAPKITIVNNGSILGNGGSGGSGGRELCDGTVVSNPQTGTAGGNAMNISSSVFIDNAGQIYAGGGGGGGGGMFASASFCPPLGYSQGGTGGIGAGYTFSSGQAGSAGYGFAGNGGTGGGYGSAGAKGGDNGVVSSQGGASGGAAGSAIIGASYVTFINRGSILGAETG